MLNYFQLVYRKIKSNLYGPIKCHHICLWCRFKKKCKDPATWDLQTWKIII